MSLSAQDQKISTAQERTLAAREALARKFPTPEAKTEHYRAMAAKANAGRVVLSGDEARALSDAYTLLGRIAARTGLTASETAA